LTQNTKAFAACVASTRSGQQSVGFLAHAYS